MASQTLAPVGQGHLAVVENGFKTGAQLRVYAEQAERAGEFDIAAFIIDKEAQIFVDSCWHLRKAVAVAGTTPPSTRLRLRVLRDSRARTSSV